MLHLHLHPSIFHGLAFNTLIVGLPICIVTIVLRGINGVHYLHMSYMVVWDQFTKPHTN